MKEQASLLLLADSLLADSNDWVGHMNLNGGWWIVMALGMVLFWGLVILGIVWLVREVGGGSRRDRELDSDPRTVLDRRFAEGTISPEDYQRRRAALGGTPVPPPTPGSSGVSG